MGLMMEIEGLGETKKIKFLLKRVDLLHNKMFNMGLLAALNKQIIGILINWV